MNTFPFTRLIARIGTALDKWEQARTNKLLAQALALAPQPLPPPRDYKSALPRVKLQSHPPICVCGKWHPTLAYPFCNNCGKTLTEGPTGGTAINMVCDPCRINFGCLS